MNNEAKEPDSLSGVVNQPQAPKATLFRKPFHTDWVVVLAVFAVAASSVKLGRDYGNVNTFQAGDWLAFAIDLLVLVAIQGLVFGVIPGTIRQFVLRRKATVKFREAFAIRKFWALSLAVGAAVSLLVSLAQGKSDDSEIGKSLEKCESQGKDTKCIEVTYLGKNSISMRVTWSYAEMREISDNFVSEIEYVTRIDCSQGSGSLLRLNAIGPAGESIAIGDFERESIASGIQGEINKIIEKTC